MDTLAPNAAYRSLSNAFRLLLTDLEALPEQAFERSLGGKARTVADIVHEVNLVNDHIVLALRGEPQWRWPQGWIVAPEDQRTKAASIAAFQRSSQAALETIGGFTPESLESTIQTDEGETTAAERGRFMLIHAWYHLGQLNYVQTLLGDDAWHWA